MTIQRESKQAQERVERSQREIEATRAAITEDLQALGEKVKPEHLKQEAADMARAAVGSAREAISEGVGRVEDTLRRVSTQTREAAQEQVEQHPFALAGVGLLAGLGIGLLFPVTGVEDRALARPTRAIREHTRGAIKAGRSTATRLREGVEEAAREVKETLQQDTQTT